MHSLPLHIFYENFPSLILNDLVFNVRPRDSIRVYFDSFVLYLVNIESCEMLKSPLKVTEFSVIMRVNNITIVIYSSAVTTEPLYYIFFMVLENVEITEELTPIKQISARAQLLRSFLDSENRLCMNIWDDSGT